MILSAQSIRELCSLRQRNDVGMVTPFHERTVSYGMTFGCSACGYDVRIKEPLIMSRGGFALASTIEHFQMPNDVLGKVADKSTWARRGLSVFNTVIEPGWHGFLTMELVYHGSEPLQLLEGMPIAQIIFHRVDQPTDAPYAGKYQGQIGAPVPAILEGSSA